MIEISILANKVLVGGSIPPGLGELFFAKVVDA
jgi:fructose-1-phosphate kinase PfkB-like protein